MKHLITLIILFAACHPVHNLQVQLQDLHGDTIHEVMYVTTRVPGIGMARYGQAIVKNGICIAHMDCRGHILKPPVYVWSCETERKRRGE
jgi:hypothetical protein